MGIKGNRMLAYIYTLEELKVKYYKNLEERDSRLFHKQYPGQPYISLVDDLKYLGKILEIEKFEKTYSIIGEHTNMPKWGLVVLG